MTIILFISPSTGRVKEVEGLYLTRLNALRRADAVHVIQPDALQDLSGADL
jgi:hypothetical protein